MARKKRKEQRRIKHGSSYSTFRIGLFKMIFNLKRDNENNKIEW